MVMRLRKGQGCRVRGREPVGRGPSDAFRFTTSDEAGASVFVGWRSLDDLGGIPELLHQGLFPLCVGDRCLIHSPQGVDCSGLVMYVYGLVDVILPRTAAEQAERGHRVSLSTAAPGDLIFFEVNGSSISHVGIYVGDGMFVHAPNSGQTVQQERVDSAWWRQRLVEVRRLVP